MRRRLLMGNKSELPREYTRLNYIQNVDDSYLVSDYIYVTDSHPTRVVVDFEYTDLTKQGYIFGTASDDGNRYSFALMMDVNRQKFSFARLNPDGITAGIRFTDCDTNRHLFEYVYNEGVYYDGVLQESTVDAASADIGNRTVRRIAIFTTIRSSDNPYTRAKAKIYALQFSDETGLARNYVPAQRISDGEIGMYETVTRTFLTNQGTGTFYGG